MAYLSLSRVQPTHDLNQGSSKHSRAVPCLEQCAALHSLCLAALDWVLREVLVCIQAQEHGKLYISELRLACVCVQEHWNLRVTASPNCVVRLSNTGPERPNGNRFKLEALTVRPGEYFMGEGMHRIGSERDHAISGGTQGLAH